MIEGFFQSRQIMRNVQDLEKVFEDIQVSFNSTLNTFDDTIYEFIQ